MSPIAFYISGHGFGHASRQIEVINALHARLPRLPVHVVTTAAHRLFDRTATPPVAVHARACDTGVVQIDSLSLDPLASIERAAAFHRDLSARVTQEAEWLTTTRVRLVVGDLPPLAFAAGAAAGVTSVAFGNFTWDWIYEGYEAEALRHPDLVPTIQRLHGLASAAWRMPMGGGFAGFATIIDTPMVARHARRMRHEVRQALGLPLDRPLALVSFGGYGLERLGAASLDCLDRCGVVFTVDVGEVAPVVRSGVHVVAEDRLYGAGLRYQDLVAAVDVVVTKPGYGILSECIANQTAVLYTSRGQFAEYDALVGEMPQYLRCRFLEQEAIVAGRWREALDALLAQPPPPKRPATNGADVAAERILAMIE